MAILTHTIRDSLGYMNASISFNYTSNSYANIVQTGNNSITFSGTYNLVRTVHAISGKIYLSVDFRSVSDDHIIYSIESSKYNISSSSNSVSFNHTVTIAIPDSNALLDSSKSYISFQIYVKPYSGQDWGSYNSVDNGNSKTSLCYYPLKKYIATTNMVLSRYDSKTGAGNLGTQIICQGFRILLNSVSPSVWASDFRSCSLYYCLDYKPNGSNSWISRSLTSAVQSAIANATTYSPESTPTLFSGITVSEEHTFAARLVINTILTTEEFIYVIDKAFAKLHLSGASTGGVGIGLFSNSTENNPKFEVAQNHKSYFYGGIEGMNNYVRNVIVKKGAGHLLASSSATPDYTNEIHRYVLDITSIKLTGADMAIGAMPEYFSRVLHVFGTVCLSDGRVLPLPFMNSASTQIGVRINENGNIYLLLGSSRTDSNVSIFLVVDYMPSNPSSSLDDVYSGIV